MVHSIFKKVSDLSRVSNPDSLKGVHRFQRGHKENVSSTSSDKAWLILIMQLFATH
jgi:hypothetical protein